MVSKNMADDRYADKQRYMSWPKWAADEAQKTSDIRPMWKELYSDLESQALAHEGQFTQFAYPFDDVMLAKLKCEAASDDPKLFFRYMSEAFNTIEAFKPD